MSRNITRANAERAAKIAFLHAQSECESCCMDDPYDRERMLEVFILELERQLLLRADPG